MAQATKYLNGATTMIKNIRYTVPRKLSALYPIESEQGFQIVLVFRSGGYNNIDPRILFENETEAFEYCEKMNRALWGLGKEEAGEIVAESMLQITTTPIARSETQ